MPLRFFSEFLRDPAKIGAVAPSSPALAREMVSEIDLPKASVVVEYGPGTGSFTREIAGRLGPEAFFVAIESNPRMASAFRTRFPKVSLVEESAVNAPAILERLGAEKADCVVSGLPWAAFSDSAQDRLLDSTLSALRDGGRFTTFAYLQGLTLPAGRRFRRKLAQRFSEVGRSRVVWRNLPPAFVYRCVK
jgi:phosphatidylethanolamine/phosphatidyl-N-methylethanolamine N-methyltransferase